MDFQDVKDLMYMGFARNITFFVLVIFVLLYIFISKDLGFTLLILLYLGDFIYGAYLHFKSIEGELQKFKDE